MFRYPRFSYEGPKTCVTAGQLVLVVVCTGGVYRVGMGLGGYQGGYTGWVIPGSSTDLPRAKRSRYQRSGPRKPPQGAGVGGYLHSAPKVFGGGTGSGTTTPCGRARSAVPEPSECRLWAHMARFDLISQKSSQNDEVSPKSVEKACNSPCFQNGLRKSPLEILRFPICPAFSHKELLGFF